jgi:hypothetical protein
VNRSALHREAGPTRDYQCKSRRKLFQLFAGSSDFWLHADHHFRLMPAVAALIAEVATVLA